MNHEHHRHGPFCAFVPPHVQNEIGDGDDGDLSAEQRNKRMEAIDAASQSAGADAAGEAVEGAQPPQTGTSHREVYDSQNTTKQRHVPVRAEGDQTTADPDVNFAYDHAGTVRQFFDEVLNRNSIDNRGLDLILNVHFGTSYNNAFWDGDEMTFGDGDGVIFSSFAASLDVVAHELAHGVTQFTSGLIYKNQSGALNEHFSDVFGTAVTQWANGESVDDADWLIGDEIMAPGLYGEALRSMRHPGTAYNNPILGKDPQPAHYDDRYQGSADRGGVHINSGIPNRAFFLAATEMGSTLDATRIWYHALHQLASNSTFAQAADQVAESARILVLSGEVPKGAAQIVRGAWRAVGVG